MTLIWSRVDQKLIHGQVSVSWVPHLKADALMVVDCDVADDLWAQKIMMLGAPPEVKATGFSPPCRLPEMLNDKRFLHRRVMAVFKNSKSVWEALDAGLLLKRLNLGNQVCRQPGKDTRLGDTFYVDPEELHYLTLLHDAGVEIRIQVLPNSPAIIWRPAEGSKA